MLKILAINSKPNLDFFTKRGLLLDITYDTCNKIFPTIKTQTTTTADNKIVTLYSPDVRQYLEDTYKNTNYDLIVFGWRPKDYGSEFAYTGGQTFGTPISNGAYFMTVREDKHVPHEMMHGTGKILYNRLKKYDAVDQMDSTWVDGKIHFYYKNEFPDDPDSNFSRTWETYKKYLPELNNLNKMTYKYFKLTEKTGSRGNHTVAELKPELVAKLDLIRGDAGIPFVIESGLRTPEENKAVGGATNSAHLTAEAVDIRCLTSENRYKIITSALKHGINRIGVGSNYIHLDISKTLPQGVVWHYYK